MKKTLILAAIFFAIIALAEVPNLISYQGKIYETATGSPVTDDEYNIRFRIYLEETGGIPIWEEIHYDVSVVNGLYQVMLGSSEPFGETVDFSEQYYLEILFDGSLMEPRYRFGASPYALNLSGMGAEEGNILKYNALLAKWEPVPALDEAQIETYIENGAIDLDAMTTIDGVPLNDWNYIYGVPVDIADGDAYDTTKADWNHIRNIPDGLGDGDDMITETEVENFITNGPIDLHGSSTINGEKFNDWDYFVNIPADIADGDDTDDFDWEIATDIGDGSEDTTMVLAGRWGIFRKGNTGYGNACSTHVNLGESSETGLTGFDYKYATVSGGFHNIASNQGAAVAGGGENVAAGGAAFIGGGADNNVEGNLSSILGGQGNQVIGDYSVGLGGHSVDVQGDFSLGYGREVTVNSGYTAAFFSSAFPGTLKVAGLIQADEYIGLPADIADGDQTGFNQMRVEDQPWLEDQITFISGDNVTLEQANDTIQVSYSGQIGDYDWEISTLIGDGDFDTTLVQSGRWGLMRSGSRAFGNACSTFVNLGLNSITGRDGINHKYITISGGYGNIAEEYAATISGGEQNTASGAAATISGGEGNQALSNYAAISGGRFNTVSGMYSTIPGGYIVNVNGNFSMAFGREVSNPLDYTAQFFSATYPGAVKVAGSIEADEYIGLPADLADGDDFLTEIQVENYITNGSLDLNAATTIDGDPINDWDYLYNIPVELADGDDVDTTIAVWASVKNVPADLADGDDVDTTIAEWASLKNIPAGIADGDDDTQLSEANVETYITNGAIDLASGTTLNGSALNDYTTLANVPADLADGDDVDTTIAEWGSIKDIPAGIADGDDDTQLSEANVETYITNGAIDLASGTTLNGSALNDYTTLANVPADLADGDDVDTTIAEWASLKGIPADIADGDDDTQLTEVEVETYITNAPITLPNGSSISGGFTTNGDIETGSANAFYFGDPSIDGTWRIVRSGDDLVFQRREAGSWNNKLTIQD